MSKTRKLHRVECPGTCLCMVRGALNFQKTLFLSSSSAFCCVGLPTGDSICIFSLLHTRSKSADQMQAISYSADSSCLGDSPQAENKSHTSEPSPGTWILETEIVFTVLQHPFAIGSPLSILYLLHTQFCLSLWMYYYWGQNQLLSSAYTNPESHRWFSSHLSPIGLILLGFINPSSAIWLKSHTRSISRPPDLSGKFPHLWKFLIPEPEARLGVLVEICNSDAKRMHE